MVESSCGNSPPFSGPAGQGGGRVTRSLSPPSGSTVRLAVLGTIALTLFHFSDNAINVDTHPEAGWQPDWFEIVVVVARVAYTAVGVAGPLAYQRGRFPAAHGSLDRLWASGDRSLGHFVYGSPDEPTTRGLVSVLVDAAAGAVVIAGCGLVDPGAAHGRRPYPGRGAHSPGGERERDRGQPLPPRARRPAPVPGRTPRRRREWSTCARVGFQGSTRRR